MLYFCGSPFVALAEAEIKSSRTSKMKAVTRVPCISFSFQTFQRQVCFADLFNVSQPKRNFTGFF